MELPPPDNGYFAAQVLPLDTNGSLTEDDKCGDGYTHVWFAVGRSVSKEAHNVSLVYCVPFLEILYVDAALNLNGMLLNSTTAVESSARFLSNVSSATEPPLTALNVDLFDNDNPLNELDAFFKTLVLGFQGVPIAELVGREHVDTLLSKMEHLYRQQIAQVMNSEYRITVDELKRRGGTASSTTSDLLETYAVNINVTHNGSLRLQQSATATILLEIVLGSVLACSIVALTIARPNKILPRDPTSLITRLGLFAGSRLLEELPAGMEQWDDKKIKSSGILEGKMFDLGWHGDGENQRFGIDM